MYKHFFKRVLDFTIVFIAMLFIWWILAIVAIWLHFANKGAGAFFFQERPGKDGKIFKVIKFKSMTDERDANGNLLNWNNAEELAALNANTAMWSPYTGKYVLTDYYVEDASFLRLSTLTLGYILPTTLTKRVGINSLRFYVTAYNVFCITNYSGFDPEVSAIRRTNLTPGVDYSAYPKSRQFVIGLNLNF